MQKVNRIDNKKFITLVANDMNKKTTKPIGDCIKAISDRLAKELVRGNEVKIKDIGTFKPLVRGGTEQNLFGEMKYVEPRLVILLETSPIMFEKLNGRVLTEEKRTRLKNDKAEKDDLEWINKRDRKPIEPIYEKIKHELDVNLITDDEYDGDEIEDDDE